MLNLGRALRASPADGQQRSALGRSELACTRTLGWRCCLGAEGLASLPFSPSANAAGPAKGVCAAGTMRRRPAGLVTVPGVAGTRGRG